MSSGMGGRSGTSRLDKSHHCPSIQREGQEGGNVGYRGISLLSIPGKVYGSFNREGAATYRRENQ